MTRSMPTDAVLAVTYRCNARCAMCGIWASPPVPELAPVDYERLPSSLRDVNLTGGEPFLRDDLPEVHAAVRRTCPRAQTVVSTNGLLTDRIVKFMKQMRAVEPGIGAAISLDGPASVHDKLRGAPGTYERALATVRALQKEGFTNLRLAFTATAANAQCLGTVYALARGLGVEFACAFEHASEHYFHRRAGSGDLDGEALRTQLQQVMRAELRSFSPKRWGRAYFMNGIWQFVRGEGRPLPCRAGRDFFFMDPSGNIYACNAMPFKMGNLKERTFDGVWSSLDAEGARASARGCANGCWMVCTARTAIRRAWPRALGWALRAKLFGLRLPEEAP
jgi:Fe-coproporphyrin III synthase